MKTLRFTHRKQLFAVLLALTLFVTSTGIAAARTVSFFGATEAEAGTTTGYAQAVASENATAGQALRFAEDATTPAYATGYPAAHNTGYPHGLPGDTRTPVVLTDYTGPMTITKDGTVIDSKRVTGTLSIKAKNVVIQNSYLRVVMGTNTNANAVQSYDHNANLLIQDTEIDGMGTDMSGGGTPLVSRTGYTLLRTNIHGSGDIIRIDGRGTVQDSWLHDPVVNNATQHNDVIQSTNATYIRIQHNRLENPSTQTSCILLKADIGPISDVVVEDNVLVGGGYSFYWYDSGYKISNGTVRNNVFVRLATRGAYWAKGGYYGPGAINATTVPTWENNTWYDTGIAIPLK